MINITLPWPPSSNTYWRRNGNRYFISKRGMDFRKHVLNACTGLDGIFGSDDRLRIRIKAFPPDKRKRDIDNLLKGILDSLQAAEIYGDDSQIDKICIERMPERSGKIVISLEPIE